MSDTLHDGIEGARALEGWGSDGDRAARVREGILARRRANERRARAVRRGSVVVGAAAALVLVLLRGAAVSASGAPHAAEPSALATEPPAPAETGQLAARLLGDAGYVHD